MWMAVAILCALACYGQTASAMTVDGESGVFEGTLSFTQPVTGKWQLNAGKWQYLQADGSPVHSKWICITGADGVRDWFCFDRAGNMCTGWQKSGSGNWYYLREIPDSRMGAMEYGFLLDPSDGRIYYMDPDTGIMRTGWVRINGNDYYFARSTDSGTGRYWDGRVMRWITNENGTRPLGSMYVNETTPDGRFADSTGVCSVPGKDGANG